MVRIMLLRHCETELNNEKRCLGKTDISLNNNGRRRAKSLGMQLKDINIGKIYSSELKRAYETANKVAEAHALEVEKLPGLNEINFGKWERLTFDEIKSRDKEKADEYLNNPLNFRFPDGETLQELDARVLCALNLILKKHSNANKTVLIVAHGGTNRIILGKALNLPLKEHWRIKQDLGCINIIDFFEDFAVVSLMNYTESNLKNM